MADNTLTVDGRFNDGISPALKQIESGIIRVVGAFSAMSTALTVIGAPILMAAEYQKQLLEVQKTTDYTAKATSYLGRELLGLSKTINVSANDLAKIAALGGQLGIGDSGAKALLSFTEEIARAVTALDVDAELAATSLGKLINIFNIDPSKYRNVISVINQLSNVSTARPEELFDILRRIGNLGGSVDVSQATALAATMVDLGLTAETAGTSITKVFADMKSNAGDFANFVGVSTDQWSKTVEKDGIGALKLYLTTLNKMPPAIAAATKAQLTGEGRIFGLITKLQEEMGRGGGLIDRRLNESSKEYAIGTSAMKEQQNVLSGLSAQWQVFKNKVASLFITAGEQTLSPLTQGLRNLGNILGDQKNIDAFAASAKNLVDSFGLIAKAVSTTIGAISSLNVNWGRVMDTASLLLVVQGFKAAQSAISFLGGAMRSSMSTAGTSGVAGGQAAASIWSKVAASVASAGAAYEANAIASRVSAAQQIADAARVATAQRAAQLAATAAAVRQQSNAYSARWLQPVVSKTLAGTVTAQEAAQLQTRLANYQRISANVNAILGGRVATEAAAQAAITTTHNAELQRRLGAYQQAMRMERIALEGVATQQAALATASSLGVNPVGASAPGIVSRFAAALREVSRIGIPAYLAQAAGMAERYATATTRAARASIVLSGAMTLIGRAVGAILSRVLGWVSWAIILTELGTSALEFLGVLDKVKDGVWSILKLFGMKIRPEFLNVKSTTADKDLIAKQYNEIIAERQKFEQQFGSIPINLSPQVGDDATFNDALKRVSDSIENTRSALEKKMVFNLGDPKAASQAFNESLGIIDKLVAGVKGAEAEYYSLNTQLSTIGATLRQAQGEYVKLNAEQGNTAATQAAKVRVASLSTEYGNLQEAVTKAARVLLVESSGMEKQVASSLSFFDQKTAVTLFTEPTKHGESLIETLNNLRVAQEAVQESAKKLGVNDISAPISNTDSFSKESLADIMKMKDAYSIMGKSADELKAKLMALPALDKFFTTKEQKSSFIDNVIRQADILAPAVRAAAKEIGGLEKVTMGIGNIKIPIGETVDKMAASIAIAAEGKKAYSEMAKIAQARADDAKNSVARALDKNKQDYKEFADFMVRTRRNLDSQLDKATVQTKTRAIDDGTTARQAGLSSVKALENDILNIIKEEGFISQAEIANRIAGMERARMYAQDQLSSMFLTGKISKETFDRETKALTDNTAMQREILGYYYDRTGVTKEEAAAIQNVLDLKYRAADRKIVDDTEVAKSTLALDNTAKAFKRLDEASMQNVGTLQYLEQQLNRGDIGYAQKVALLEQRNTAQAQLTANLAQLRAEAEKFSNVDPIAGKVLVDEAQVAKMQDLIKRYTEVQASLNVSTAGQEKGVYQGYANQLSAVAQGFEVTVTQSIAAAEAMGTAKTKLEEYITVAKSIPEVAAQMQLMNDTLARSASGIVAPVNPSDILKNVNDSIQSIKPDQISKLPPLEFSAALSQNSLAETRTNLATTIAEATKAAEDGINSKGGLKLNAEVTATKVNIPGQTTSVVANNRDGGHIQGFDSGGDVRGAGTGRSDSILSWLSHGEYVMDATTVRMLGSGFFRTLQSLAQRGTNLSRLRSSLPAFKLGGPVSMAGLSGISPDGLLQSIANDGGDTMNVDLSMNGVKRSRLRGSREQVESFVSAMRDLKKGMA